MHAAFLMFCFVTVSLFARTHTRCVQSFWHCFEAFAFACIASLVYLPMFLYMRLCPKPLGRQDALHCAAITSSTSIRAPRHCALCPFYPQKASHAVTTRSRPFGTATPASQRPRHRPYQSTQNSVSSLWLTERPYKVIYHQRGSRKFCGTIGSQPKQRWKAKSRLPRR